MISLKKKKEYYQALLDKNSEYEGVFFVGVKTTGVFCRPTCPARKPKFENCEFFISAKEALLARVSHQRSGQFGQTVLLDAEENPEGRVNLTLPRDALKADDETDGQSDRMVGEKSGLASFRPCQRCHPLFPPNLPSNLIQILVEAVEKNPEKRWKDCDFREISIDASTARRQFKKRFGITFVEYARARRMGIALKQIREGSSVIDAQLSTGYGSSNGFRDAFSRIMGAAPTKLKDKYILKASWLDTPLGPMIAIANEEALHLLEFADRLGLEREVELLRQKTHAAIIPGSTAPIRSIENELSQYFDGKLRQFKTPLFFLASPFQKRVWEELTRIPFGETRSYSDIAKAIGHSASYRAVARANGANQLAIVIPCHRVVSADGSLSGYGGGATRKKWLIDHEKG